MNCAVAIALWLGGPGTFGSVSRTLKRVGQYTIERRIGSGGQGEVYKAFHVLLRRPVAIQMLRVKRFEQEVSLSSELTHPNTVAIYDYGVTADGLLYYAMEYLDGLNLADLVAREGRQPVGRVVYILKQICGSLGEAHDKGIIHRDIKPENIILFDRGGIRDFVKVIDFGLARRIESAKPNRRNREEDRIAGTPMYLSPEAIRSPTHVDERGDLYALGAVGYFLLTGLPMFEAKSVVELCRQHLETTPVPPSVRLVDPGIGGPLEEILLRCLAKNVSERPESALAVAHELDQCAAGWTAEAAGSWPRRGAKEDRGSAWRGGSGAPTSSRTLTDWPADPSSAVIVDVAAT